MHIFYIQGTSQGCVMYSFEHELIPNVSITKFHCTSTQLMMKVCEGYETNFEGNRKTVRKNHNYIQKTPLLLLKDYQLFFPTCSHKEDHCCWVNFYNVSNIVMTSDYNLFINFDFKNYYSLSSSSTLIEVPCNRRTLRKQMKRCEQIDKFVADKDILFKNHALN